MTEREDEIRERLEAFLDRWQEMTGHDPDVIYGVGDREGELLHLTNSDLRALLAEVENLTASRDRAKDYAGMWCRRAEAAEAEAATLREVVREVVALRDAWANGPAVGYDRNEQIELDTEKTHARSLTAALGDAPEGDGGGVS